MAPRIHVLIWLLPILVAFARGGEFKKLSGKHLFIFLTGDAAVISFGVQSAVVRATFTCLSLTAPGLAVVRLALGPAPVPVPTPSPVPEPTPTPLPTPAPSPGARDYLLNNPAGIALPAAIGLPALHSTASVRDPQFGRRKT